MTPPVRPRRSALFMPADNPRALARARTLDADVIILDLEDAVAPSAKAAARTAAVAAASEAWNGPELVIRVNGLASEWAADDLAACAEARPDAVLIPKVGGPKDLFAARDALGPGAPLWAMIETCLAVGRLQAIADATDEAGLAALVVGANDLALEMRARPGPDRAELSPILAFIVAAARSRGLAVIDAVCNDYSDLDRVAAECAQGRALGFDGKSLIHPAQIAPANAAFAPDVAELTRARAIAAAFADPANAGRGAIALGGRMVERLHLVEAERTLALAEAIAARTSIISN